MKTKEEIDNAISRMSKRFVHDEFEDSVFKATILSIIKEELSKVESLNPNRIDEERMASCFEEVFTRDIYSNSIFKTIVDKYNSTLPEIKELEPLPNSSDLGDEIYDLEWHTLTPQDCEKLADYFIRKYGIPKREELPSVDKLADEILALNIISNGNSFNEISKTIARYIIDKYKYSLPKREWWMDLKEGEMINTLEGVKKFKAVTLVCVGSYFYKPSDCTPYIEPNTKEKLLAKLDDEGKKMLEELLNEIK